MRYSSTIEEDYKLWSALLQTRDALMKLREKEVAKFGLLPKESRILFIIQLLGKKATPTVISKFLFRERHSISELLTRMEKKGLIRRVRDLDRKNWVRVELAQKGIKVYNQTSDLDPVREIISCLSREEHEQLMLCLQKLRAAAVKKLELDVIIP